ncbi:MAG TPA: outer membrane beta-barrel protein [Polyangia bacterium]|nr:outer membrane beta-barrel protein [Polyangia bacterium]
MNRRLALSIASGALAVLLLGSVARAQEEVTIGYQGLPYKSSGESNTGIQVADGVLLHSGVGVEAGYDSNVFYASSNAIGSSILRVMPFVDLTNATRTGPASKTLTFDLRAGLLYRRYFSDDPALSPYANSWNPNAGLSLSLGGGQIGFGFADVFARIEDPPYQGQAGVLERNNNQASAELRWAPGGGRLSGTLRYTNMIDIYGTSYQYANAMTNTLMLDVSWKWLPKTAVFVNIQQGYVFYFNDNVTVTDVVNNTTNMGKASSFPLYATAGLRGLLTEKTSGALTLGYVNAFYSEGTSTSGFLGSTYADLNFTVRPNQLSRIVLGVRHDFLNSVISNFSYEDTVYASYVQQIAGRLALDLSGRFARLDYQGNFVDPAQAGRIDHFWQFGASLDYFLRNWAYLGVGYSLLDNNSNKPLDSYVKQQVFARLGVTY